MAVNLKKLTSETKADTKVSASSSNEKAHGVDLSRLSSKNQTQNTDTSSKGNTSTKSTNTNASNNKVNVPTDTSSDNIFQRLWNATKGAVSGGAKQSLGSNMNAMVTAYESGQGRRTKTNQENLDYAKAQLERSKKAYAEDVAAGVVKAGDLGYKDEINKWQTQIDAYQKILNENVQQKAAVESYKLADTVSQSGAADIDKAKESAPLGIVGDIAVDAMASTTQSLIDGAANVLIGGQTMLPFAFRAFGGATQQARQDQTNKTGTYSLDKTMLYGAASAAKEVFTEKMFNIALPQSKIYGGGMFDDKIEQVINKVASKFLKTGSGQKIFTTVMSSALSEGLEEFIGDWIEMELPRIYGGDVDSISDTLYNSLYDFAVGGVSGLMGTPVQIAQIVFENQEERDADNMKGWESAENAEEAFDQAEHGKDYTETMQSAFANQYADTFIESEQNIQLEDNISLNGEKQAQIEAERINGNKKIVNDYSSMLDSEGQRTLNESYDGTQDAADFVNEFTQYYNTGLNGDNKVFYVKNSVLNDIQREQAFKAGIADRVVAQKKAESNSSKSGLSYETAPKNYNKETAKTIDTLAKKLGVRVEFGSSDINENGSYNSKTKTITLNPNSKNPVFTVLKHEITHRMQDLAPKQYQEYKDYVIEMHRLNGNLDGIVNNYLNAYRNVNQNFTRNDALDEIVADYSAELFMDDEAFSKLVKSNRTLAQKIHDTLVDIINAVRSVLGKEEISQLTEAEKKWRNLLEAATKESSKLGASVSEDANLRYNLITFPPYNKSHSEANQIATRWAARSDVEVGVRCVIFYNDSPYLIEKFSDTDYGYQIIKKVPIKEYRRIYKGVNDVESNRNISSKFGSTDQRGDGSLRGESGINSNGDGYQGQNSDIAGLDKSEQGWGQPKVHRSSTNESGSKDKTRLSIDVNKETLNSLRKDYEQAYSDYMRIGNEIANLSQSEENRKLVNDITNAVLDSEGEKEALKAYADWEERVGVKQLAKERDLKRSEYIKLRNQLEDANKEYIKQMRSQYTEEFNKKYASKAAKKFGTTGRFNYAGYLTINGSLLDFSQGQRQRVQDHREISDVLDFLPDGHDYSAGLIEFMNMGNIRMQSYGIDISKAPNQKQVSVLRSFFNSLDGEVTVDFSDENGSTVGSIDYEEGTSSARILNDIKSYFETGVVPELSTVAQFHTRYQLINNDYLKYAENLSSDNATEKDYDRVVALVDMAAHDAGYNLKAYHGSKSKFTVFDLSKSGKASKESQLGFWFTQSRDFAEKFGEGIWYGDNPEAVVYDTYIKLQNPKIYETGAENESQPYYEKYKEAIESSGKAAVHLKDTIKKMYSYEDEVMIYGKNTKVMRSRDGALYAQMLVDTAMRSPDNPYLDSLYSEYITDENRKVLLELADRQVKLNEEQAVAKNQYMEHKFNDAYEKLKTDIYKMSGQTAAEANLGGIGKVLNDPLAVKKFRDKLISEGYDGIIIRGTRYDAHLGSNEQFVVFNPEQIKLSSPITYDDNNNVIPLSQRFNEKSNDIRYSLSQIEEQIQMNLGDIPTIAVQATYDIQNSDVVDSTMSGSDVNTLAVAFREDLINTGHVSLVGQIAKTPKDLAVLAQVYRDPRFETTRYFFLDDNDKIVYHTGISSSLADSSALFKGKPLQFFAEHANKAKAAGATKVYFLHNHPSGRPKPSGADQSAALYIKRMMRINGLKSLGGVIINSNQYSTFIGNGAYDIQNISDSTIDELLTKTGRTELLEDSLDSPNKLAEIAKAIQLSDNYSALIYIGAKLNVTAVQEINNTIVKDFGRFSSYIENNLSKYGAIRVAIVVSSEDMYQSALGVYESGIALDLVRVSDIGSPLSAKERGEVQMAYSQSNEVNERWSLQTAAEYQKEVNSLTRQNETLKKTSERLKHEIKASTKITDAQAKRIADALFMSYPSVSMTKKELTETILKTYRAYAQAKDVNQAYIDLKKACNEIATKLVNESGVITNPNFENYADLRTYLQKVLRGDKARMDSVYQDLMETYPEFFSTENITSEDAVEEIKGVLENLKDKMIQNPFKGDEDMVIEYASNEILATLLDGSELTKTGELESVITNNRIKAEKLIAKINERNNAKIQNLMDKYKAKTELGREKQNAKLLREKIMKHSKELSDKLLKATDKKHIPQELQGAVAKLLESINLSSNNNKATKRTAAAQALKLSYESVIQKGGLTIDPDMLDYLKKIISMSDTPIGQLSSDQLQVIWNTIKAVEASIFSANRVLAESKYATVSAFADNLRSAAEELRGPKFLKDSAIYNDVVRFGTLTPQAYFHRLGSAGDEIFRLMRKAQDKHITLINEFRADIQEISNGLDINKLEKEMHTFDLSGGKIELSTAQIMGLYELSKRPQAQEHIYYGGIRAGRVNVKNNNSALATRVTPGDVSKIISSLTDEQKNVADKLQKYMAGNIAKNGNEASMAVYGYEKFGEKTYYPIGVDYNEVNSDITDATQREMVTIASMGSAKVLTPHAKNAIMIESIFDVVSNNANDMAKYSAWLATMETLNKVRNFKFTSDGRQMKSYIEKALGLTANKYFTDLLKDINSQRATERAATEVLVGKYKQAAIGANLRVILQQPTSIMRAMAIIDPKYLLNGTVKQGDFEKVKRYAPIAIWKDWGYFDINTGRTMKDVIFNSDKKLDKINEAMMQGAALADSITWGKIWNACELEISDKTALTKGTSEYYQAVAERFNEIIDKTQVVDGVLQRSALMRSPQTLNKWATSFMSEPIKTLNMAVSAVYDVSNSKTSEQRKAAKKVLGRTVFALLSSFVANAIAQSLVDGMRDDDDEEYWRKFIEAFIGISDETTLESVWNSNFVQNFNPATYIPYLKDLVSIAQGYSVERMDYSAITKVFNSARVFINAIKGTGKYTVQYASANFLMEVSKLFGLPISNIKRDALAVFNTVIQAIDDPYLSRKVDKAKQNFRYK